MYELVVAHIILLNAEWAAGLRLNVRKCVIVPLAGPLDPD